MRELYMAAATSHESEDTHGPTIAIVWIFNIARFNHFVYWSR
jgi:hypothetical protein